MATLARHLHNKGIRLKDPLAEQQEAKQTVVAQAEATPVREAMSQKPIDVAALVEHVSNLSLSGPVSCVTGTIGCPVISGRWENFDHDSKTTHGFVLMRMMVHNAAQVDDFTFKWINKRTLQITQAWPDFMQKCIMLTTLDITSVHDDQGNLVSETENFPVGHKVYDDMGKNTADLEAEDGKIYCKGQFRFLFDMKEATNYTRAEILEADVGATTVLFLQVQFAEEAVEHRITSPSVATVVRKKGGRLRTSPLNGTAKATASSAAEARGSKRPLKPAPTVMKQHRAKRNKQIVN